MKPLLLIPVLVAILLAGCKREGELPPVVLPPVAENPTATAQPTNQVVVPDIRTGSHVRFKHLGVTGIVSEWYKYQWSFNVLVVASNGVPTKVEQVYGGLLELVSPNDQ